MISTPGTVIMNCVPSIACKNSRSVMTLNGIFQPVLMLLRVTALYYLYLFVYQRDKISRGTLRARFSQVVFSISSRRVENSIKLLREPM